MAENHKGFPPKGLQSAARLFIRTATGIAADHVLRVAQGHALAREQRRLRVPAGLCLIRCAYAPKLTLLAASTKLGS